MSNQRNKPGSSTDDSDDSGQQVNVRDMLLVIQNKVMNSSALNGGFDTLINKMDNFEKQQFQVIERVDEIHEAVYNPDEGLFARVKDAELTKTVEIQNINAELSKIKLKHEHEANNQAKESENDKDMKLTIESLKSDVKDIKQGYNLIKYFVATLTSGIVISTMKMVYDFISTHVKFM